jgi:nitrous oxidase accessory protein NosD
MAPGVYAGQLRVASAGRPGAPIFLCGPRDAILAGETIKKPNYVLHLDGAAWWRFVGFTVRRGRKGVMADRARHNILSGLAVSGSGDEAVHLRAFSTDNLVQGLTVRDTGHRRPKFGEGIYVGSAHSNWCKITACRPDRSDRNAIVGNDIAATTSESIDVKEGTSRGVVSGNRLSGRGLTAADSWIDVKGNGWRVVRNSGVDSPEDGIQVHVESPGWGERNVIRANRLTVNGAGYGVYVHKPRTGNVVGCDNVVVRARRGRFNVACRR